MQAGGEGQIQLIEELGQRRLVLGNPRADGQFSIYTFNRNGWLVGWYRAGQAYSCGFDGRALRSVRVGEGSQGFVWSQPLSDAELDREIALAQNAVQRWREQKAMPTQNVGRQEGEQEAVLTQNVRRQEGEQEAMPTQNIGRQGSERERHGGNKPTESISHGDISAGSQPTLLGNTPRQVGERFRQVWGRVAILPPDQYAAAVVQLTQGCAYNGCRFCTFYKDVPYRVREKSEFVAHLRAVQEFFGAELGERRGLFLAAANAANAEDACLFAALGHLSDLAQSDAAWRRCWQGGVASFLDTFSQNSRSRATWQALREAGLTSLYLGVETGSASLRRLWRKPGQAADIVALVERLKDAGLKVGVIVLSGAEAEFRENDHNGATARLLNRLPLDGHDRVYISEYRSGQPFATVDAYVNYRRRCRQATEDLQAQLCLPAYPQGALISLYDVWQYLYR